MAGDTFPKPKSCKTLFLTTKAFTKLNLFPKIHSVFSLLNICESHCKFLACVRDFVFVCVRSFPKSHIFQLLISLLAFHFHMTGCALESNRRAVQWVPDRNPWPMFACRHREIETNRSSKSYACDRCIIADITKLIIKRYYKVTR